MPARSNPNIKIPESSFPYTESISKSKKLSIKDVLWILHREIAEESNKRVPGWRGWLSLVTSVQPPQYPSVVEYMRPIHHPATDNTSLSLVDELFSWGKKHQIWHRGSFLCCYQILILCQKNFQNGRQKSKMAAKKKMKNHQYQPNYQHF